MRRTKHNGSFLICLFINLLLNLEGTIPALLLLMMHFLLDWSIWWFWIALGLWILGMVLWMGFFRWARRCNTPTPHRENKNPHSKHNEDLFGK